MMWAPSSYLIELVEATPKWALQTDWANNWLVADWYLALGVLLLLLKPGRLGRAWSRVKDETKALAGIRMEPAKSVPIVLGAIMMTVAAIALWWQVGSAGDGDLHVYFSDVGQGDSALIVTPDGRQVLVDGGPKSDSAIQALYGAMPSGDRSLDLVVMTHLDSDHSRGLLGVLDGYKVGAVLSRIGSTDATMYAQWQASVTRNRVDVISVRETNSFGHPSPEVVGRLLLQTGRKNLYQTDQDGEVEFVTDGRNLWVNTER